MDLEELICALTARVERQLAERGGEKKKLFLLMDPQAALRSRLESPALLARYRLTEPENATDEEIAASRGGVLDGLSWEQVGRLAAGCPDDGATRWAARLLLAGKPVWVPLEGVPLGEKDSGSAYLRMMRGKLDTLKSCGLSLCPGCDLTDAILGEKPVEQPKRVVTEAAVIAAKAAGAAELWVGDRAIITALAEERAQRDGVTLRREGGDVRCRLPW